MQRIYQVALGGWMLALLLGLATRAEGALLRLDLNVIFSGCSPAGAPPWLVATFDDAADSLGAKGVRLTLSTSGLVAQESVGGWYFNFDPSLNAALLQFTAVNTSAIGGWRVEAGNNGFKADGDGWYDFHFFFPESDAGRFTSRKTVVFDIFYPQAITAASFDFLSLPSGGAGTFASAAHIQAIGSCAGLSGWIGTDPPVDAPEPASIALLGWGAGMMAFGLVFRQRRRETP